MMKVIEGTKTDERLVKLIECVKDNFDIYNDVEDWEDVAHYALALLGELARIGNPYHIIGLHQCNIIHIYRSIEEMGEEDE